MDRAKTSRTLEWTNLKVFLWKIGIIRIPIEILSKNLKSKRLSRCETFDWQVMVEIKTVATEKYRYFYQEESASTIFLEFLDWKRFQEVIKTNFSPNQIMIFTRFFIEKLIQPKVGKKNQFEERDESIFWAVLRRLYLSRILYRGLKETSLLIVSTATVALKNFPLGPDSEKRRTVTTRDMFFLNKTTVVVFSWESKLPKAQR